VDAAGAEAGGMAASVCSFTLCGTRRACARWSRDRATTSLVCMRASRWGGTGVRQDSKRTQTGRQRRTVMFRVRRFPPRVRGAHLRHDQLGGGEVHDVLNGVVAQRLVQRHAARAHALHGLRAHVKGQGQGVNHPPDMCDIVDGRPSPSVPWPART